MCMNSYMCMYIYIWICICECEGICRYLHSTNLYRLERFEICNGSIFKNQYRKLVKRNWRLQQEKRQSVMLIGSHKSPQKRYVRIPQIWFQVKGYIYIRHTENQMTPATLQGSHKCSSISLKLGHPISNLRHTLTKIQITCPVVIPNLTTPLCRWLVTTKRMAYLSLRLLGSQILTHHPLVGGFKIIGWWLNHHPIEKKTKTYGQTCVGHLPHIFFSEMVLMKSQQTSEWNHHRDHHVFSFFARAPCNTHAQGFLG